MLTDTYYCQQSTQSLLPGNCRPGDDTLSWSGASVRRLSSLIGTRNHEARDRQPQLLGLRQHNNSHHQHHWHLETEDKVKCLRAREISRIGARGFRVEQAPRQRQQQDTISSMPRRERRSANISERNQCRARRRPFRSQPFSTYWPGPGPK